MDFSSLEKQYDVGNLKEMLGGVSHHISQAYAFIDSHPLPEISQKPSRAIVCGMGGSCWYTEIVNALLFDRTVVDTCSNYVAPAWAEKDTLVIASSYSGNTEETLAVLESMKGKAEYLAGITAGGQLLTKFQEYNIPFLQIMATGIQPRMSTLCNLAYLLHLLHHYGLSKDWRSEFMELETFLSGIDFETSAKQIAEEIGDKVPVIYSAAQAVSAAKAWKICINENSKTQAFYNYFPELNHNEMCGFTNMRMNPCFIFLHSSLDHPKNAKRMDVTKEMLQGKGNFIDVDLKGETLLQQLSYALVMGYWVSYYVALANHVDPTPVDMVEDFKAKMK